MCFADRDVRASGTTIAGTAAGGGRGVLLGYGLARAVGRVHVDDPDVRRPGYASAVVALRPARLRGTSSNSTSWFFPVWLISCHAV